MISRKINVCVRSLECTRMIINDVISSFKPDFEGEKQDTKKRLQIECLPGS